MNDFMKFAENMLIICGAILISYIVCVIFCMTKKKSELNSSLDDSCWNIDIEHLRNDLKKYLAGKSEDIKGILGLKNAEDVADIDKRGFCFVTEKAYYFVGNVLQKKGLFSWRTNVQHRIVADEMKGIKISNIFPQYALFVLAYLLFSEYELIRVIIRIMRTAEHNNNYDPNFNYVSAAIVAFIGVLLIIYDISILRFRRQTVMDIEFASQVMRFPINELGKQEIKEFYKATSSVQQIIEGRSDSSVKTESIESGSAQDSLSKLKELNELYEKGVITKEEFDKVKQEII